MSRSERELLTARTAVAVAVEQEGCCREEERGMEGCSGGQGEG